MRTNAVVHLCIALALLVVVSIAYGFGYLAIGEASTRAALLAGELALQSEEAKRIDEARATLTSLAADEGVIREHFVGTDKIVPFLESLEARGRALGSKVSIVSVAAEDAGTKTEHIRLALNISGPFSSVLKTLGTIEYGPRDTRLVSLTLDTPRAPTEGAAVWSAAAVFEIGTRSPITP